MYSSYQACTEASYFTYALRTQDAGARGSRDALTVVALGAGWGFTFTVEAPALELSGGYLHRGGTRAQGCWEPSYWRLWHRNGGGTGTVGAKCREEGHEDE